jgi:hypothetical protein
MRSFDPNRLADRSRSTHSGALCALVATLVALGNACDTGGSEGEVCNPLVLQDECNAGLHCQQTTCSTAYCCPTNGSSSDPNCNAGGCPDAGDAGDGSDAAADTSAPDGGTEGSAADGEAGSG